MEGPFADLTYDLVFKKVFTDKEILFGFLNAIGAAGKNLTITSINNVERPEANATLLYDIHCTLSNNISIIIELQKAQQRSQICDRITRYLGRDYSVQARKKGSSYLLDPVHAVVITCFTLNLEASRSGSLRQVYEMLCTEGDPEENISVRYGQLYRHLWMQLPLAPEEIDLDSTEVEKWAFLLAKSHMLGSTPPAPLISSEPLKRYVVLGHLFMHHVNLLIAKDGMIIILLLLFIFKGAESCEALSNDNK